MSTPVSRKKVVLGVAAGMAVAIVLVVVICMDVHSREVRSADGTVLRLEKVSFGKREPLRPGGLLQRAKETVAPYLPKKWGAKLVPPRTTNKTSWSSSFFVGHTNEPALQVWVTRIDRITGSYTNVGVDSAELVDSDGCVFGCTAVGGEDNGLLPAAAWAARVTGGIVLVPSRRQSSVNWFTFEVFPRRESTLKLRLFDARHEPMAEYTVANPVPRIPSARAPAPVLPASVTNGDVAFKLANVRLASNLPNEITTGGVAIVMPREYLFDFEYFKNGMKIGGWDRLVMDLGDSSGNVAPKWGNHPFALCPSDPTWKLKVVFCNREEVANPSESVKNVLIPINGAYMPVKSNIVVDGLYIRVIGLGGGGSTTYSNRIPIGSAQGMGSSVGPLLQASTRASMPAGNIRTVASATPHLAVVLGDLRDDQRLSVVATDGNGRKYYLRDSESWPANGPVVSYGEYLSQGSVQYIGPMTNSATMPGEGTMKFLLFDEAADSKIVDLKFTVHRTQTAEFVFKPPGREQISKK